MRTYLTQKLWEAIKSLLGLEVQCDGAGNPTNTADRTSDRPHGSEIAVQQQHAALVWLLKVK
jgi:hypothetical protein